MSTRIGPLTRVAVFVGTTLISCTISPPITAAQGGTDGRQREREFLEHRTFQGTAIERDAYDRALEEWRRLEKATPASAPRPAPGPSGPTSTLSPLSLSSSSAVTGLTGTVWTPMVEDLGPEMRERRRRAIPLGVEGTAWDVGWAAVYLASDEARWVTGQTLVVDGGLTLTTR